MPATDSTHFVDLLRHGEPAGGDRFRGALDDPLSETGWQQMRTTVDGVAPWDLIITSPLKRCAEFASELADRHGLALEVEPELREIAFGQWEGVSYQDMQEKHHQAFWEFFQDPVNNTPPGAEPLLECQRRVHAAWDDLIARNPGKHLLVVAHGAVIRIICSRILETPPQAMFRLEVPYASLTRVRCLPEGQRIVFHGKTA